jgi:hypothetical protein
MPYRLEIKMKPSEDGRMQLLFIDPTTTRHIDKYTGEKWPNHKDQMRVEIPVDLTKESDETTLKMVGIYVKEVLEEQQRQATAFDGRYKVASENRELMMSTNMPVALAKLDQPVDLANPIPSPGRVSSQFSSNRPSHSWDALGLSLYKGPFS